MCPGYRHFIDGFRRPKECVCPNDNFDLEIVNPTNDRDGQDWGGPANRGSRTYREEVRGAAPGQPCSVDGAKGPSRYRAFGI